MPPPTEDKVRLIVSDNNDKERTRADETYAKRIVETVMFGILGAIGLAVIGAILKLILI